MPFSTCGSLSGVIPANQRRLAAMTVIMYLLFTLIVVWRMLSTSFTLG